MSSDTALTSAYVSPVALGPVVKPLPPDKHTDSGSNLLPLLTFLFVNDVVDGRFVFDVVNDVVDGRFVFDVCERCG